MIQRKLKVCKGRGIYAGKGCGQMKYIYAHGLCNYCYNQHRPMKPLKQKEIRKYKPAYQDSRKMSQKDAFLRAWYFYKGRCFIGGDPIPLEEIRTWNCLHILDKKNYPYFKYYWRNIIIGLKEQHDLIDQGTEDKVNERIRTTGETEYEWKEKLPTLREELLREYKQWIIDNPKRHKL